MTIRNLDYLLAPKSVAIIGASAREGSVGKVLTDNILEGGFSGPVWPVNPKAKGFLGRRKISGCKACPTIADLPQAPDLGIIAIPPQHVARAVADLAARGTRAAVVITAGLDKDQSQQMLSAGQSVTMRIQGPNCLGLMLPQAGLNASFSHIAPPKGDIAFLSQSGALILAVIDWAAGRSIGFSHVLSLGDMADVDFGDMLDYLAADHQSRAILMYMENIKHAAKFMSAARRAARVKPVVAIKAGRHEAAARAAFSHTGSMAGADHAYSAAFRRAGIVRVETLHDLLDAAEILTRVPALKGDRLTILTNGGGAGILATDRLVDLGGELTDLSDATRENLDRVLPANWSKANPVDIIGDANAERYAAALDMLMSAPETECILAINCPTALASSADIAERIVTTYETARGKGAKVPLLTNWLGEATSAQARNQFSQANIPTFQTPAAAVNAHSILVGHRKAQLELSRTPPSHSDVSIDQLEKAQEILSAAQTKGADTLSELDAKHLLACYGIPTASADYAHSAEEARRLGEAILKSGQACVIKIASESISHKSDVGGVRLNLTSPESIEAAAAEILALGQRLAAGDPNLGVVVQPMIYRPKAVEVIAGMSVDNTFGPLMMFGAGGTAVEVLRDVATALPPLDMLLAREMIARTRVSSLLAGYRDRPAADIETLAATLVKLSYLVAHHPSIRELDINPLLADADGVIALDARVKLGDEDRTPRRAMSIRPYPIEWETEIFSDELGKIAIRPVRPTDEPELTEFYKGLSVNDLRLRFFTSTRIFSHSELARVTQIDYAREMTFLAFTTEDREDRKAGAVLGSVRLLADPDYEKAEYAVVVRSDLKGRGLGWCLMQHLINYARHERICEIYGTVLRENTTMLKMCKELGFVAHTSQDDPMVMDVTLDLRSH